MRNLHNAFRRDGEPSSFRLETCDPPCGGQADRKRPPAKSYLAPLPCGGCTHRQNIGQKISAMHAALLPCLESPDFWRPTSANRAYPDIDCAHLLQGHASCNAVKARTSNLSWVWSGCAEPYFTTTLTRCSIIVLPGMSVHRTGSS